jgi:NAD(P)-dependent dehydrogenase (short-subunit alcohol dehydrogenase family)
MNLPAALSRIDEVASWHATLRRLRSAVLRDLMLPDPSSRAGATGPEGGPLSPVSEHELRERVAGKRVLITGGSSGIGLESAKRVAAAGAKTIICGRDPERLAQARLELGDVGDVSAHSVDIADLDACDGLAQRLLEEHGGVDILINNAGRSIRRSVQHSLDRFHDFQRTMQLNYFGALRLTLALLPAMASRRSGHVINVSSIGVLMNAPRFAAYSASKAALDAWTRCAAGEYADLGIEFTG